MPAAVQAPRVLVVDDDEGVLLLMTDALAAAGYAVSTATSGAAALDAVSRAAPDVMLLDLKMRDVDGPALLDRLRAAPVHVPVIVVTGQGDEKSAVEVMKRGVRDYVIKDAAMLDRLPAVVNRVVAAIQQERALASANAERDRLAAEVVAVAERERHSIGADLHDGVGQILTAVELMAAGLRTDLADSQPAAAEQLQRMGSMLREAVSQTRYLARGLVPVASDGPDALPTGLAELAERTSAVGRLRCRFIVKDAVSVEDRAVASQLYRIAQEAVNNAVKHSGASEVTIRLGHDGGSVLLEVADNGRGLRKGKGKHDGIGLGVMRYRAGLIGAALDVQSRPGKGVAVRCRLPRIP